MVSKLLRSLLIAGFGILCNGAVVVKDWELTSQDIAPDGFTRSASLVNGQYPGPLLALNKYDTAIVNVNNHLSDPTMCRSTSIHWHGIFQHRNAQNDGPSFVTQCPIAPNNTFTYKIVLGDQAGTFWYHSHLSTQYVDGIRGPIVIYDPEDPHRDLYDVDDETTVISLSDWYHQSALTLTNAWFNGSFEPVPDSGLINSAGRYNGGPEVPYTRINVTQGKRYRLRLVCISANAYFNVSIQNHRMTIIEADGISTVPYDVDSLFIAPAQRYSVVITANQTVDNYWIRATTTFDRGNTTSADNPNFNGTKTLAVLHYDGAPDCEPTSSLNFSLGPVQFEEYKMAPLLNPGAPGGDGPADQIVNLTYSFTRPNGAAWIVNGHQYESPSVPTLLNILSNANPMFGANENTITLQPNAVIEVAFIGGPLHPFHIHGHSFDVIQSVAGPVNYVNPPRRDTVLTHNATNPVRIRFKTDNPGPWFLHCHIEWHLEAGLAVVFAEDVQGIKKGPDSISPNQQWKQLCKIYNSLPADEK